MSHPKARSKAHTILLWTMIVVLTVLVSVAFIDIFALNDKLDEFELENVSPMEIGRTIDEHESRLDDVEEVNQRQDSELEETVKTLSGSINDLYDALETAIRRSF